MLDDGEYLDVISKAPLVSIDLVIVSEQSEILVGLRTNEPAIGTWFVPGGAIKKNETLPAAFDRITSKELGRTMNFDDASLLGAFTHIYDANFMKVDGIGTHYVVLAYRLDVSLELSELPTNEHNDYRWISEQDDLTAVHPNTTAYFDYV